MGNSNPYYDPDEDADILETPAADVGSTSFVSSGTGNFNMMGGKDLPPELREALSRYVNLDALDDRPSNLPDDFLLVSGMMDFYNSLYDFRRDGVLLGAVAEVLDDATEGRVKITYAKMQAERTMIYTTIVASFGAALDAIQDDLTTQHGVEVREYLEAILEINDFLHRQAVDMYLAKCEELGKAPDENLINTGLYTSRDFITKVAFAEPPAYEDPNEY